MEHFPSDNADLLLIDEGEARRAYITELIAVAADDARNIIVVATVSVGATVFLIKDAVVPIRRLGAPYPALATVAAALLLVGAAILFWYAAKVNHRRMNLARCLASSDAVKASELWAGQEFGIKTSEGILLRTGSFIIAVGAAVVITVVSGLLLS